MMKDPRAWRNLGCNSLLTGQFQEAKNHFCQAVTLAPGLLGEILVDYETAIASQPKEVGPRLSLICFSICQGDM